MITDDGFQRTKFGFLRLFLAIAVVLSHSVEMLDHNRSGEFLTRMFGTISSGDVAVDGFFLMSGYLIAKSWESSRSWRDYLVKRLLRIYPGFIVAFLISLLVIGPIAGGDIATLAGWPGLEQFARLIFLRPPQLPGAFATLPDAQLNGPLWTVACEFRCYVATMLLGGLGILRNRRAFLVVTALILLTYIVARGFNPEFPEPIEAFTGRMGANIRFFALYCTGVAYFLFRDRIRYRGDWALLALIGMCAGLYFPRLAGPCVAVLGGYILFWFAFRPGFSRLERVGSKIDLSYGIYLYAWPVQNLIIAHDPGISPWLLFLYAMPVALLFACFSWFVVESPCRRLKTRLYRPAHGRAAPACGIALTN